MLKPIRGTTLQVNGDPLTSRVAALWPMNEGGGRRICDLSGGRYTLIFPVSGPTWARGPAGFALAFDDAAAQYLEIDQAVAALPLTLACWFKSDDLTAEESLVWIGNKNASNLYHNLYIDGGVAGDPVTALTRGDAGNAIARTTSGCTPNGWHFAAAVFVSDSERHVYLDGGSKGSDTTTTGGVTINRASIARRGDVSPGTYLSGSVQMAAIFGWALSDEQIWRLYGWSFWWAERADPLRILAAA